MCPTKQNINLTKKWKCQHPLDGPQGFLVNSNDIFNFYSLRRPSGTPRAMPTAAAQYNVFIGKHFGGGHN